MTPKQAKIEYEKLAQEFNEKLIELNVRSKLFFHGNISMKIIDLNHDNEYAEEAHEYMYAILPIVRTSEEVTEFLNKMFPKKDIPWVSQD